MASSKNNVDLICSVGELAGIFAKSQSLDKFLQQTVSVVAWHMRAAVCSVYLLDRQTDELVLNANQGLNPASIGTLRLKIGEGIVGTAVRELRSIREGYARSNPHFKYIPDIGEESYQAFLVAPILRGSLRIGALVVQDPQPEYFDENDEKALRAIAAQLASTIENANLLLKLHGPEIPAPPPRPVPPQRFDGYTYMRGISCSTGFAEGRAAILALEADDLLHEPTAPTAATAQTAASFEEAFVRTEQQLQRLQTEMEDRLADVASLIFSSHLLILKDEPFSGAMRAKIRDGTPPVTAVVEVVNDFIRLFTGSGAPLLHEKILDLKDLGYRLLRNLSGVPDDLVDYRGHIVITGAIVPSDLLRLSAQYAEGIVLVGGGAATHLSILARSLNLPMVAINDRHIAELPPDTPLLVDASAANLFINPTPDILQRYRELKRTMLEAEQTAADMPPETYTVDGTRIHILANVNLLSDIPVALRLKAEGVGLYRSEFPFMVRPDFPSEEEQYRIYVKIVHDMAGREVTFRTLDIGGDKALAYFPMENESNPFLGLRALRFSLHYPEFFTPQLRALLRAGAEGPVRIMFPFVSSVDDFEAARDYVFQCSNALQKEGVPCVARPSLGVMIELPSAVELADELAQAADFLSIGTNDLVQYTLAADRTNAQVTEFYQPHHPAILRALARVVRAARRHHRPVSICGDIAANPIFLPFLAGIGIQTLSLDARHIPPIKRAVTALNLAKAETLAARLLKMVHLRDIEAALGLPSQKS